MTYEPLKDYEFDYEILNELPYTIRYKRSHKIVNIRNNRDGYKVMTLNNKMKYLHKIIANHFIPNPNNLNHVMFIDGNKNNISLSNLKWCSRSDINKLNGKERKKTKTISTDILEVKYSPCESKEFEGFI